MLAIRAVALDLDGTLFNTEDVFFRAASDVLAARGRRFTPELMAAMIGRRAVESYPMLAERTAWPEPPEALRAEIRAHFETILDDAIRPMPGLLGLLDAIAAAGLPLAVATSSTRRHPERLLGHFGLRERFRLILSAEDVERGKPEPDIYLLAAERLGVPAPSVLVVEDSVAGIASGVAAGCRVAAIPHDHSPAGLLAAAHLIASALDDPILLAEIAPPPAT